MGLTVALLLVVLVDASGVRGRNRVNQFLTVASLIAALALCFPLYERGHSGPIFSGMLVVDPMAVFFKIILIGASLLVVLSFTFRNSRELAGLRQGPFYSLLLPVTLSTILTAAPNDLALLYLSLEMVSITSYVMVAY